MNSSLSEFPFLGTTEVARVSLKMNVNKPASWSAQNLRTRPVIPSGLAAFLTFTLFCSLRWSDGPHSLSHASRVIELKMRLNSLPVSEFGGSYCMSESIARCFVLAHVSQQKTSIVCGSALVNRSTDCTVHPWFLIWECPCSYCFSSLIG